MAAACLFPVEKTVPPGWVLALIAVCCAMLSGARLGLLGLNTLWAEDGQVFYQGALNSPMRAFIESYRGYLSTTQRIIAVVVAQFPVSWVAAAFDTADAIVVGLLAALAYRACDEHIRNPWLRAVPSITIAACPVGQETWGSVADLQWPMYFVAFVVLLWNPRRPMPIAVGTVTMILLALTSPFGALLLPIAVLRIFALGRGRGSVIPLAMLVGVALQVVDMAIVAGSRHVNSVIAPVAIAKLYEKYVAGPGFFGIRYQLPWQELGTLVLIAALAALVIVVISGRPRQPALAALALVYSVGYFVVLIVLSGEDVVYSAAVGASRYDVDPFLLLAFTVTVLLDSTLCGGTGIARAILRAKRVRTPVQRRLASVFRVSAVVVCAALTCCLAWSVTSSWNVPYAPRQKPTWSAELAIADAKCDRGARRVWIPIEPVEHPAIWHVILTCAQLR